jgi:hypothetical protein
MLISTYLLELLIYLLNLKRILSQLQRVALSMSMKEEIENAIRILKMTDEEVVSTSTYNAIARYL